MDKLDDDVDEMFEKIKNPAYQRWHGSQGKLPFVYESPDGGETVYARPFGSTQPRTLVKGESRND